ncbi:MAG: hypothetical protein AAF333_11635 [Planctomycetota bacterium]
MALCLPATGCQYVGRAFLDALLDRDYVYRNDFRPTQAPETRRWSLRYTEHLQLTSDLTGVHAVVNGEDLGPCPVTTALPTRSIDIEETGFYPAVDEYELKFREEDDGSCGRLISERYVATHRARGPTQWVGHRTVTADLPPLTVEWVRGSRTLGSSTVEPLDSRFTLKTAPDNVDPVLLRALRRLDWNSPITEPTVPGEAVGQRHLRWPPPEQIPAAATTPPTPTPAP